MAGETRPRPSIETLHGLATHSGWELKAQSPTRISGSVVITIAAGLPDRRRCDADTLPKAILDLLVAHQVIEDDAKAVDVRTRRDENVPPGAHRHQRG